MEPKGFLSTVIARVKDTNRCPAKWLLPKGEESLLLKNFFWESAPNLQ
jgi:hypothetical protein